MSQQRDIKSRGDNPAHKIVGFHVNADKTPAHVNVDKTPALSTSAACSDGILEEPSVPFLPIEDSSVPSEAAQQDAFFSEADAAAVSGRLSAAFDAHSHGQAAPSLVPDDVFPPVDDVDQQPSAADAISSSEPAGAPCAASTPAPPPPMAVSMPIPTGAPTAPSSATSATAPLPTSASLSSSFKPRKTSSEMSKAERRAVQEEQRAKKAAGKPGQGDAKAKAQGPKAKAGGAPEAARPGAGSTAQAKGPAGKQAAATPAPKTSFASMDIFSHLPPYKCMALGEASTRQPSLHPAVLELGLAYSQRTVTGSSARSLAMMVVLKRVVQDFEAPPNQAFTRALLAHINTCVSFFWEECRPACVPQRNCIKWLKEFIPRLEHTQTGEDEARALIMNAMDNFLHERFTMASKVLVEHVCKKIEDGAVVMTFGRSSVVQQILLEATKQGKRLEVMCVDTRQGEAGEQLCSILLQHGVKCSYLTLAAISHCMKRVSLVLLGAAAVLSNGAVVAPSGSAMVALAAAAAHRPVLVCAQSVKFHEDVRMESITSNEQGDPEAVLTVRNRPEVSARLHSSNAADKLSVLNLCFDTLPVDFVTLVATEFGLIPPTSVLVILREKRDDEMQAAT